MKRLIATFREWMRRVPRPRRRPVHNDNGPDPAQIQHEQTALRAELVRLEVELYERGERRG